VDINLGESGVYPVTLEELNVEIPRDLELGYTMTKGSERLRSTIATLYNTELTAENIVVTCGSSEANFLITLLLAEKDKEFIVQLPNYMNTYGVLKSLGLKVKEWWLDSNEGFKVDIEKLKELVNSKTKAIFITNPNNPTGRVINKRLLKGIVDIANDYKLYIVSDEVFRGVEFSGEITPSIVEMYDIEKAVAISGLSKVYGLPGIRIGWTVSSVDLANKIWELKDYTTITVSTISSYIAEHVLSSNLKYKLIERAKSIVRNNLSLLMETIKNHNDTFKIIKPEGGTIALIKILNCNSTLEYAEKLFNERRLLIIPGETFNIPGYFRIGLGVKPNVLNRGLSVLLDFFRREGIFS